MRLASLIITAALAPALCRALFLGDDFDDAVDRKTDEVLDEAVDIYCENFDLSGCEDGEKKQSQSLTQTKRDQQMIASTLTTPQAPLAPQAHPKLSALKDIAPAIVQGNMLPPHNQVPIHKAIPPQGQNENTPSTQKEHALPVQTPAHDLEQVNQNTNQNALRVKQAEEQPAQDTPKLNQALADEKMATPQKEEPKISDATFKDGGHVAYAPEKVINMIVEYLEISETQAASFYRLRESDMPETLYYQVISMVQVQESKAKEMNQVLKFIRLKKIQNVDESSVAAATHALKSIAKNGLAERFAGSYAILAGSTVQVDFLRVLLAASGFDNTEEDIFAVARAANCSLKSGKSAISIPESQQDGSPNVLPQGIKDNQSPESNDFSISTSAHAKVQTQFGFSETQASAFVQCKDSVMTWTLFVLVISKENKVTLDDAKKTKFKAFAEAEISLTINGDTDEAAIEVKAKAVAQLDGVNAQSTSPGVIQAAAFADSKVLTELFKDTLLDRGLQLDPLTLKEVAKTVGCTLIEDLNLVGTATKTIPEPLKSLPQHEGTQPEQQKLNVRAQVKVLLEIKTEDQVDKVLQCADSVMRSKIVVEIFAQAGVEYQGDAVAKVAALINLEIIQDASGIEIKAAAEAVARVDGVNEKADSEPVQRIASFAHASVRATVFKDFLSRSALPTDESTMHKIAVALQCKLDNDSNGQELTADGASAYAGSTSWSQSPDDSKRQGASAHAASSSKIYLPNNQNDQTSSRKEVSAEARAEVMGKLQISPGPNLDKVLDNAGKAMQLELFIKVCAQAGAVVDAETATSVAAIIDVKVINGLNKESIEVKAQAAAKIEGLSGSTEQEKLAPLSVYSGSTLLPSAFSEVIVGLNVQGTPLAMKALADTFDITIEANSSGSSGSGDGSVHGKSPDANIQFSEGSRDVALPVPVRPQESDAHQSELESVLESKSRSTNEAAVKAVVAFSGSSMTVSIFIKVCAQAGIELDREDAKEVAAAIDCKILPDLPSEDVSSRMEEAAKIVPQQTLRMDSFSEICQYVGATVTIETFIVICQINGVTVNDRAAEEIAKVIGCEIVQPREEAAEESAKPRGNFEEEPSSIVETVTRTFTDLTTLCPVETHITASKCEEEKCSGVTLSVGASTSVTFPGTYIVGEQSTVYKTSTKFVHAKSTGMPFESNNSIENPNQPPSNEPESQSGDGPSNGEIQSTEYPSSVVAAGLSPDHRNSLEDEESGPTLSHPERLHRGARSAAYGDDSMSGSGATPVDVADEYLNAEVPTRNTSRPIIDDVEVLEASADKLSLSVLTACAVVMVGFIIV